MEINQITLLIIVAVIALGIGAIVAYLIGSRQINRLRNKYSRLMVTLSYERKAAAQKEAAFQQVTRNLKDTFNALAGNVLKENSAQFLHLAQENLKQFQVKAESDLDQREKAVETLVKPIREALDKTESQIRMMEKERKEAHGALTKHLETMADSHRLLQSETRHLVQALRRPEVRGQWGEMTLKRLAELAGMVEHCDFREQESVQTESGMQRPDMVIRMPDKREVVVDSKTPLDAYLAAVEASDDDARKQHLKRHAQNVRERVRELASKAYWEQFPRSPDFIVLFIPGDQFLSSALDMDRKLLEDALSDNVILATPTSLVALLRAIAYGWRQDALAENAEVIRVVGTEMFLRLTTFAEHLAKLGRSLDSSVETFNKAVGSFDSRVLPSARKFTELGITTRKKPPDLQQIERATRTVASSSETESTH
ncbi:MAG: DNA recombination protein RmuC [Halobacteria archaeon]|nr:DNA recombination protein RmuC [Halobacteria archaeon]